jgi:hypothetical protein
MSETILNLINDIEILLKHDERFYNSNDYLFKNKIKHLTKPEKPLKAIMSIPSGYKVDGLNQFGLPNIISLKNLSKLNTNTTSDKTCNDNNIDLTNIIDRFNKANKKIADLL